jgi:hypothetical protein
MIREYKPKRIIEIGSGFSTLISAMAIKKNLTEDSEHQCNLLCVDPYPKDFLYHIPEISEIIQSKVEALPIDFFSKLEKNDILFIDSSHIIKLNNDVCFEYLELLPNLNKNVLIHFHDIVLPKQYCEYWYDMKMFWNEQYLLQAFLAFNNKFTVLWAGNYMHLKHPEELEKTIPSYSWFKKNGIKKKTFQGHKSFWIKK